MDHPPEAEIKTDYLWSWRIQHGYLTQTDYEIDEIEEHLRLLAKWREENPPPWSRFTKRDWLDLFGRSRAHHRPPADSADHRSLTADEIKRAVPILVVLQSFGIKVRKTGTNRYVVLCPAHNDKNPSCSVDNTRGLWHCFSCGAGGSTVDLVMALEHCTVSAALTHLRSLIAD